MLQRIRTSISKVSGVERSPVRKQVSRLKSLADPDPIRNHLHDPPGSASALPDVILRLFRPQRPAEDAAVSDFVIGCQERDLAFLLELTEDLTEQRLLVGFHREEEVGPPAPANTGKAE